MSVLTRMIVLLLAALGAACGSDEPEPLTWRDLSAGFRAQDPAAAVTNWRSPSGAEYLLGTDAEGSGFWIGARLSREAWSAEASRAGFWSAERSLLGVAGDSAAVTRLQSGELVFRTATPRDAPELLAAGTPCYFLMPRRILIGLPEGTSLPEDLIFGAHCDRGFERDGAWRAHSGFLTANGISLLSGQRHTTRIETPRPGRLAFGTGALGMEAEASLRFQVFLDGEVVFDHEQMAGGRAVVQHQLEVPVTGEAELRFEVSGQPGVGTFVTPTLGPGTVLHADRRPDIVIFLADTFRADNLACYGGVAGLAPNLDQLASASVRFESARSPASWTLPAMSSLLSGLYPPQHGAEIEKLSMSDELVTLAEQFGAHGYRTGAVTDSGFVTASYGMDQGFQEFQEFPAREWSLTQTLKWSLDFLQRDDGRPVFLLVHTYRTHYPYRQGPEEDFSAWIETLERSGIEDWKVGRPPEELLPYADDFRSLYEDGVGDLDEAFGSWWEELEQRGWVDRGYLVFASDHGEAFGEHLEFGHGGQLWDEKIRVPLLIHGPTLEPRGEARSASLVDLGATLARVAGIRPDERWQGTDLLDLQEDRPLLSYNSGVGGEHLAIVAGEHKVLTLPDEAVLGRGEFELAFDLSADPGEQEPGSLAGDLAGELCRSLAERVRTLGVPLASARTADVSQAKQDELDAIGYGGE